VKKATVVFGALGVAAAGAAAWFFLIRGSLVGRIRALSASLDEILANNPAPEGKKQRFVWQTSGLGSRLQKLINWANAGAVGDPPGGKVDAEAIVAQAEAEVAAGFPTVNFKGYRDSTSDDPLTASYVGGGVLGLSRRNALEAAIDGGGYPGGGLLGLGRW